MMTENRIKVNNMENVDNQEFNRIARLKFFCSTQKKVTLKIYFFY